MVFIKKGISMLICSDNKKTYSSSIVMIGNFSPMMFQPYWFKYCNILNDDEFRAIEEQKKTIITEPLTVFETDNLAFKVETKRFTIIAKKEPFELLKDTFDRLQEKLESVLIEKFGLNFSFHLDLKTPENFKQFGDEIAPKKCWSSFFEGIHDSESRNSGLMALTMRKQTEFGFINVRVESSVNYSNALFFDYNFHYDGNLMEPFDILDVNEVIGDHFDEYAKYADRISLDLVNEVLANGK